MSIAKTRIHMICGICGSNEAFSYEIDPTGADINGELSVAVFITCSNCAALTDLGCVISASADQGTFKATEERG